MALNMATITQTVNTTTSASARVKTTTTVVATLAGLTSGGGSDPGNPTVFTTRSSTTWTAPATVTSVDAVLVGAAGGPAWRTQGGAGAYAHVEGLPITGGLTYTLTPGTGGRPGGIGGAYLGGEPGGGDGGSGGAYNGGGGGGYTAILDPGDDELIVVGGGAGAGTTDAGAAGDRWGSGGAAGESGEDGNASDAVPTANEGGGATPSAGGAGGTGAAGADGVSGADLQGGVGGASVSNEGGGGGGGGFKGGGGGEAGANGAGGGGGSSKLIAAATAVTFSTGVGAHPVPIIADLLAGHSSNPNYSPNDTRSLLTGQSGAIRLYYNQVGDALPEWFLDDDVLELWWAPWELSAPALLAPMHQNGGITAGDRVPSITGWKGGYHLSQGSTVNQATLETSGPPDADGWYAFAGSQWYTSPTIAALPAGYRMYAVLEWTNTGGRVLFELGNLSASSDTTAVRLVEGSVSTLVRNRRAGTTIDGLGQMVPTVGLSTVEAVCGAAVGELSLLYNDAEEISSGTGTTVEERHAAGTLSLCAQSNGTAGFAGYLKGLVIAAEGIDSGVWGDIKTWMEA